MNFLLKKYSCFINEEDLRYYLIYEINNSFSKENLEMNLPHDVYKNNDFIGKKILEIIKNKKYHPDKLSDYMIKNHKLIKFALRQWFLLNAGVCLEFMKIPRTTNVRYLRWLNRKFKLKIGDKVLYRHVISNNIRNELANMGYKVPYKNWVEFYTRDALRQIAHILKDNLEYKGIWNEGTWIYDPGLFANAPDGKPFASFSFLKSNKYVGQRYYLGLARANNDNKKSFNFAVQNKRRRDLFEKKQFNPKAYGFFYKREQVLKNFL